VNLSQFRATQRFNPAFNLDGDEVSPALVYWGNYWIKVTSYEGSVAYWLVLGNQDWLAKTPEELRKLEYRLFHYVAGEQGWLLATTDFIND